MLRTILILTALIVFSGKVFAGDYATEVIWYRHWLIKPMDQLTLSPNDEFLAIRKFQRKDVSIAKADKGDFCAGIPTKDTVSLFDSFSFYPDNDRIIAMYSNKVDGDNYTNYVIYSISSHSVLLTKSVKDTTNYTTRDCDVSPDGKNVVSIILNTNTHDICIHDAETLEVIKKLDLKFNQNLNYKGMCEYSKTGKYIIVLVVDLESNAIIRVWDTDTWEDFTISEPFPGYVKDISFSDDDKVIAISSTSITHVIDIQKKNIINSFEGANNVILNGNKIAVCGFDLNVYDYNTKERCYEYAFGGKDLVMTKDKKYFYTTYDTGPGYELMKMHALWDASDVADVVVQDFIIEITPNPVIGNSTINITSPETKQVEITITDLSGNTIMKIFSGMLTAGENEFPCDCSRLPSGSYFCTVSSDNASKTRKIVVAR
ncbi:MAG: T9SS type A sorting domain-containing protein [Candidatus Kapabacteria bacterium]|jgi:WD40 repeat protein|nr:T9SS type A sorting domain-containing protein [Candidatus Kapabacteria bacterium]